LNTSKNHYSFLREINRMLQPGLVPVLTTPNIAALGSRVRFFGYGSIPCRRLEKKKDSAPRERNKEIRRTLYSFPFLFGECLMLIARKAQATSGK
jgi:hypothetical protein